MEEKILISITGKSGAGKSFFSKILAEKLDAELLSLDKISHLSLENEEIKSKLESIFGVSIFDENHKIIRKNLGNIAFKDSEKLNLLNSISQDFMEKFIDEKILNCKKKYIILEYALLTKMKYFYQSKFKILITASENTRFSRLMERDNISEEYLRMREKNIPEFKTHEFDEILENNFKFIQDLTYFAEKIAKKIQTSIN